MDSPVRSHWPLAMTIASDEISVTRWVRRADRYRVLNIVYAEAGPSGVPNGVDDLLVSHEGRPIFEN